MPSEDSESEFSIGSFDELHNECVKMLNCLIEFEDGHFEHEVDEGINEFLEQ